MDYKKAFYSKLEDCYLGVKIKDFHQGNVAKSGFSNLLKIKEQYFAHIKAYLESQIESEPLSHDIYNKLYTFFDSYLNESGTPFFSDTPIYKNIYAKVYSNSKDTSLFYKTQNLYYVKSDTLYQSLTLSDEKQGYEVVFDASEYKQNADNTKNKIIFKLHSIQSSEENKPQILIKVSNQKDLFPELNNVFKQNSNEFSEEFLKDLKQNEILKDSKTKINEEELKKIFRSYKKQSEIDFFIHKNATTFLKEQFDLWMFGYLYKESAIQEWNPEIIAHLQRIKNIAYEIIKLIADFENELKAVWLKPKFAKKTEYVFSVDIILQHANNANALIESIVNDKGFEAQIKEWRELKLIDDSSPKGEDTIISPSFIDGATPPQPLPQGEGLLSFKIHSSSSRHEGVTSSSPSLAEGVRGWAQALIETDKYRYLPIDTKHFTKETKYKILSSFENLESILNGELIKADNFQALNTLMPKYQGKVDLIYIDPPYNTGSDGFIYADNFNHASWLSMMNNRLELSKELLNDKGSMFISIDDKEQARLKLVCDEVFGEENFVSNVIWRKRAGGGNDSRHIANEQEYLCFYAKNAETLITNGIARPSVAKYKQDDKGYYTEKPLNDTALQDSVGLHYDIKLPNGKTLNGNEHQWKMSESTFLARLERNEIIFKSNDKVYYKHYIDINSNLIPASIWYDLVLNADATQEIKSLFKDKAFDTPKPEKLLKRICEIATKVDSKAEVFEMRNCGFQDKGEGSLVSLNDQDFGVESAIYRSKTTPIVLDFFAGSGTTLAVAQKLGRKWLGVEMGEHFYSVVIPRLKKVITGFQSGISKECDYQGGGAFRYYELESYEEALSHCEYVLHQHISRSLAENSILPPPLRRGLGGGYSKAATLETKSHHYLAPYMKEFSRELRKNPTQAENKLWQELRNKKLGFGFRRQFVIDSKYIADFVCLEKRLIIECDGGQHSESFEDKERDFYLESQNFRILRFWNNEILENLEGAVERIQETLNDDVDLTHPLIPSAREGESKVAPSVREGEQYKYTFAMGREKDGHTFARGEESLNTEIKDSENNAIYKGKDYAKAKTILDYRKSRKLIDKLSKGESVCLDMRTEYREDFDIFHTMANLMGWNIKRLFLDSKGIGSCEFDNGEIISLDTLDLYKYPKLKNLIWW